MAEDVDELEAGREEVLGLDGLAFQPELVDEAEGTTTGLEADGEVHKVLLKEDALRNQLEEVEEAVFIERDVFLKCSCALAHLRIVSEDERYIVMSGDKLHHFDALLLELKLEFEEELVDALEHLLHLEAGHLDHHLMLRHQVVQVGDRYGVIEVVQGLGLGLRGWLDQDELHAVIELLSRYA